MTDTHPHDTHLRSTHHTGRLTRPLLAEFRRQDITHGAPLFLPAGIPLHTAETFLRLRLNPQRPHDVTLTPHGVQGDQFNRHLHYTAGTCSVHLWPVETLHDF